MSSTKSLIFATQNRHKLAELQALAGPAFTLLTLEDAGITEELEETQPTLEGNALQKARYVFEKTGKACFADDTGLEVEALNGAPGVLSARYAGEDKNTAANIAKLLQELRGSANRRARFRSVFAWVDETGERLFEGIVDGEITQEPRGNSGFGYDPVFLPEGGDRTFAEMELADKNKISHRARALARMAEYMQKVG